MPEVVSIASVWRDRARVAEEAAAELDELAGAVGDAVLSNYFGTGCVEGEALFNQLTQSLRSWQGEAAALAGSLRSTARNCRVAADSYTAEDLVSMDGMGR